MNTKTNEVSSMRRALAVLGFAAVLGTAAASFVVLPNSATRAAASRGEASFVVPANDGYGIGECLATSDDCGKIVAAAWCEAQGYVRAVRFGPAVDVTGSVEATLVATRADRPITITCAD